MAAIPTPFIQVPFATSGDKTVVPIPTQSDGSVSYTTGFGPDYELGPSDPAKKDVPRNQTNQLFNDLSTIAQEYQVWGVPNFISTSDNGGTPFPYSQYARVLYDDGTNGPRVFESKINTNTGLPVTGTTPNLVINPNWRLIDLATFQATIYDGVTFNSPVANGNAVYYDAANSRYDQALANGSLPQNVIGIADVTNSRVLAFGLVAGLSGLTGGGVYYLSPTTPGALTLTQPATNVVQVGIAQNTTTLLLNIQLAVNGGLRYVGESITFRGSTVQPGCLAENGAAVSRTTYAVLFSQIGTTYGSGDGSTTFNLPNSQRCVDIGSGGTAISPVVTSTTVGPGGGEEAHAPTLAEMFTHNHGVTDTGHHHTTNAGGDAPSYSDSSGSTPPLAAAGSATSTVATGITINNEGSSTPFNVMQPCLIATKMIYTGVF